MALSGGSGLCSVIPRGGPRLTDGVRDPPYLPTPDTCCHLEIIILFWRGSKKFSRRIAFNQHALRPPLSPLLSAPTSHYKSMKSQIKDHEKLASPQGRDILPPPPSRVSGQLACQSHSSLCTPHLECQGQPAPGGWSLPGGRALLPFSLVPGGLTLSTGHRSDVEMPGCRFRAARSGSSPTLLLGLPLPRGPAQPWGGPGQSHSRPVWPLPWGRVGLGQDTRSWGQGFFLTVQNPS